MSAPEPLSDDGLDRVRRIVASVEGIDALDAEALLARLDRAEAALAFYADAANYEGSAFCGLTIHTDRLPMPAGMAIVSTDRDSTDALITPSFDRAPEVLQDRGRRARTALRSRTPP